MRADNRPSVSREVESVIHRPLIWVPLVFGTAVFAAGAAGFALAGRLAPIGWPRAGSCAFAGFFALTGAAVVAKVLLLVARPARVRHAARDVLPLVPSEPLLVEGTVVQGRLRHELVESERAVEVRPSDRILLADQIFLYAFGGPFLIGFSALLSWVFHSRLHMPGWPLAIAVGVCATGLGGLPCFLIVGRILLSAHRQLARLTVPLNGDALTLETAQPPVVNAHDLAAGLQWLFGFQQARERQSVQRRDVVAVQICPWKHVCGGAGERSVTWAAQGLLVIADAERACYRRLPLLATGDFVGAARLMRRLALALGVPFLFDADAEGWKAEARRAKSRRPLRAGGSVS